MCNRYICGGFLISVSTLAGFLAGIRYTQQQNMQTMQVVQVPPQSLAPNSDTPTANKERSERSLRLPSLIALKAWLHEREYEDNHSAPASVSSRWVIKRQHDISGHDIALQLSHRPKDVKACQHACEKQSECRAFTWPGCQLKWLQSLEDLHFSSQYDAYVLDRSVSESETASPLCTRADCTRIPDWAHVDLSKYNELAAALDASLRLAGQKLVEGHSAQLVTERKLYLAVATLPFVGHICEIGFNAGHSASLWLLANPDAQVTMFDLWSHPYAATAEAFLRSAQAARYGVKNVSERLGIIKGSSHATVRSHAAKHPRSCDIISVDGEHTYVGALQDLLDVRPLFKNELSLLNSP